MHNSYSVGGHIEALCPRCNLKLGHTIIAIVDNLPETIKCDSCDEHHDVSVRQSAQSRIKPKSATRKTRSKQATYEKYLSRLKEDNPGNFIKYNIKGNFEKDQIIDHLKFGIGIVLSVLQKNKIEILFKDGPRLLIQNQ